VAVRWALTMGSNEITGRINQLIYDADENGQERKNETAMNGMAKDENNKTTEAGTRPWGHKRDRVYKRDGRGIQTNMALLL
jgi:hypothetical protein